MNVADKLYKAVIHVMSILYFHLDLINQQPLTHVVSVPFDLQRSKKVE